MRDNELDKPYGIAVGREGQIFIADRGNHCIQISNANLTYKGMCSFPDHVGMTDIYPEKIANNLSRCWYIEHVAQQLPYPLW